MQKQVSKQSLAIIALSILLAISMALTATFAAFSASAEATGTVTFVGNTTITLTNFGGTITGNGTDNVAGATFAVEAGANGAMTLTETTAKATLGGSDSWVKITLVEDSTAVNKDAVAVALKATTGYELVEGVLYSTSKVVAGQDIFDALPSILNLGTCNYANLVNNSAVDYTLTIEVRTTNDLTNPLKPAQP